MQCHRDSGLILTSDSKDAYVGEKNKQIRAGIGIHKLRLIKFCFSTPKLYFSVIKLDRSNHEHSMVTNHHIYLNYRSDENLYFYSPPSQNVGDRSTISR